MSSSSIHRSPSVSKVPGLLLIEPPQEKTQDAQLPTPLATRLLYSQEPSIPSENEEREPTPKPIYQVVIEKDFEVFYPKVAPITSTMRSSVEMGFEEKTLDLLTLPTAHVGGISTAMVVTPRSLLLQRYTHPLLRSQTKRESVAREARVPKGSKRGRLLNPRPKKPTQENGSRRRSSSILRPLRRLVETNPGRPLSRGQSLP